MALQISTVVSEDDIQATYTNDKFGNSVVFASDLAHTVSDVVKAVINV